MNPCQQRLARLVREVQHHVPQKDHVESIARAIERQNRRTQIGPSKVAELANLRLDDPVLADVIEVANHKPRRQAAIDLNALKAPLLRTLNNLRAKIRSFNAQIPANLLRKMFEHQHCNAVALLPRRAGSTPETQAARGFAGLDQFR